MKFFRIFALLLSVFCVSQGFCHERQDRTSSEKVYIQPSQISFLSDGIFILLNNQLDVVEQPRNEFIGPVLQARAMSK